MITELLQGLNLAKVSFHTSLRDGELNRSGNKDNKIILTHYVN